MSQPFKTRLYKSILLSMVFSLVGVTIALAASGDLDPTFSVDGRVRTDFAGRNDFLTDIAILSNGKIVAAGISAVKLPGVVYFAIARYHPNGKLDTTFGGDGKVLTNVLGLSPSIAVQSDGKIVAADTLCFENETPYCDTDVVLVRYKTNGALDTTFSGDGKVVTDFGGAAIDNSAEDLAIQPDGKIVVAGEYYDKSTANRDFAVYRYLPNGRLDKTFNGDGRARIDLGTFAESAVALAIQPWDGKIVVVGNGNGKGWDFMIVRLNPNGSLDKTFSGDGIQLTNFKQYGDDIATDVAFQRNRKIVVVGARIDFETDYYTTAIARYNSNGSLDNTFGQLLPTGKRTGKKIIDLGDAGGGEVVVQPDGKIVVSANNELGEFILMRLKSNSGFDSSFNGSGIFKINFGGEVAGGGFVRQKSDGKYVIGNVTYDGTQYDFLLARVLP